MPVVYSLAAGKEDTDTRNAVFRAAGGARLWKFWKMSSPTNVTYSPLDGSIASRVTTTCVQDYLQICGPSGLVAVPQIPGREGNYTPGAELRESHSPDTKSGYGESLRNVVDLPAAYGNDLQDTASHPFNTCATNQGILDSVQLIESYNREQHVGGAALVGTIPVMEEGRFEAALETSDDPWSTTQGSLPQLRHREIASDPPEFAFPRSTGLPPSPHHVTTLNQSSPHRPQVLRSSGPLVVDLSSISPPQGRNVSVSPQAGITFRHLPSGIVPGSLEGLQATLPGSAQDVGTGQETAGENLTRREKNRRAAARSNERRRVALEALKLDIAKAKAESLALTEREARAKTLNRQLKEEAARRWMRSASES